METNENLTSEEKRLLDKIRAIRESKKVAELISKVNAYSENLGIPKFKSRIKEEASALKKFREKEYTDADRLGDICGMMFITEDESQIYEAVEYMERILTGQSLEEDDYVKKPKAGYRSFHMNAQMLDVEDLDGVMLPMEIQIKTRSMSIAQDTVHDSIYKNPNLEKNERDALSAALFPIFERCAEMDRLLAQGREEDASKVQEEIDALKSDGAELFAKYGPQVKQAYREYGKVVFKQKNEWNIEREGFLAGDSKEEKATRYEEFKDMIEVVFDYYEQEGNARGEDGVEYATKAMKSLDYNVFSSLLKDLQKTNGDVEVGKVEEPVIASIADFEAMDGMVSPQMRESVLNKMRELQQTKEKEGAELGE